ncbi:MAG: hypothetical protein JWQ37_678 [Blastococcus sp.]|nr:hypothetical protein [Blastococcus sp.]
MATAAPVFGPRGPGGNRGTPPRDDVPAPVVPPTASERLGPAPVLTPSQPAMVAPEPPAGQTMPVAAGTLRRAAARDGALPDFLDDDELTRRMAQVLQDEARRYGIEV